MKTYIKLTFAAAFVSAALSASSLPAVFADAAAAPAAAPASLQSYALNGALQVEIKTVLNERVKDGTRLGAVVRLTNTSGKLTRVPDYELRLKTSDGTEYTLQPSASNVPSVSAKSSRELSYMLTIDRTDEVTVTDVEWIDVDLDVYPKKETLRLDVPAAGLTWQGAESVIANSNAMKKWGESFTIPALTSPLVYKPVDLTRDFNGSTPVTIVQVLVENPSAERQALPDLAMDGKTATDVYGGQLVEQGPIVLDAGEKRYIHFAVQTDLASELKSLNVLTVEKFAAASGAQTFNVGRLNILLPTAAATTSVPEEAKYKLGTPIVFDKLNKIIHPSMEVSLVELHISDNDKDGFKTALAKFKLVNNSDRPLPVPSFNTELISRDGYEYMGYGQANTPQRVLPSGAATVSYSFTLPKSQEGSNLQVNILDTQTVKPYKSVIASLYANEQHEDTQMNKQWKLYPFDVTLTDWSAGANYSLQTGYTYKLKLFLDIKQDPQVVVDGSSPKLQVDVLSSTGKLIGSVPNLSFTGVNALLNGENEIPINANTQSLEIPFTLRIYETFSNTNGELVKRLLTTLK